MHNCKNQPPDKRKQTAAYLIKMPKIFYGKALVLMNRYLLYAEGGYFSVITKLFE